MVPRYGWTGLSPITKVTTSASCWATMHKQSACSWWSLMVSGGGGLQPTRCPQVPIRSARSHFHGHANAGGYRGSLVGNN